MFDLKDTKVRILACTGCTEPVSAEIGTTFLELECGYCGKHDRREIAQEIGTSIERAYRGKPASHQSVRLVFDLGEPPKGLERFRKIRTTDLDALKKEWRESIEKPRESDQDDRRITFLGVAIAWIFRARKDAVRSRAILESTLEHLRHPAYRGLVLARLSMAASRAGGTELAQQWLDKIALDTRVVEVKTAARVARAMIMHAKADHRGVLDVIGQQNTFDEFIPPFRALAVALRMDAHENLGELEMAYGVWNQARPESQLVIAEARADNLAPKTRQRIVWLGSAAAAVLALILLALASLTLSITRGDHVNLSLVAGGFAGAIAILVVRRFLLP